MKLQPGLTLSKEDLTCYKAYKILKAKVSTHLLLHIYRWTITLFFSLLPFLHFKVSGNAGKMDLTRELEISLRENNCDFGDVELS